MLQSDTCVNVERVVVVVGRHGGCTHEAVFGLDVAVNNVSVVDELERRAELNEQVARVTLRVRVLVIKHVTQQVHATLTQ